eukprot:1187141-Prorocentrum_minimum.AAC.4
MIGARGVGHKLFAHQILLTFGDVILPCGVQFGDPVTVGFARDARALVPTKVDTVESTVSTFVGTSARASRATYLWGRTRTLAWGSVMVWSAYNGEIDKLVAKLYPAGENDIL